MSFKVPLYKDSSVRVEEWNDSQFYNTVHFHKECQLTLIVEGRGKLIVGTNTYDFKPGDVYLFGKNLPHGFRNDETFGDNEVKAHHISVFFNMDAYSFLLKQNPETSMIKDLLAKSLFGLKLINIDTKYLSDTMKTLASMDGFDKVLELLNILDLISRGNQHDYLTTGKSQEHNRNMHNIDKINEIFKFINSNYGTKISLASIANRFNMTPATFGRFFKLRTQKTFSQYLIEIRILKACELIRSGAYNTTESCYNSGFTNISNFHRHFKKIMGMTPTQYKFSATKSIA
ncbi:AraC family transcriptional regulator [Flavivirga aquimarina]|uniref:AraC family transcriptional regulator n=1 Tax=Flavivirga aquimarina TaxID=2027862 RepID=A0ABT8W6I2_9FLAO|nr:AraC family transcriptional regulator [Flavivirga aquimarina]